MGAVVGTLFAGLGVGLAVADNGEDRSGRAKWVGAGASGAIAAIGWSTYLVSDEFRRPLLSSVMGASLLGYGATFYVSDRNTPATHWSFGSMMATGLVLEGLVVLDTVLKPTVSAIALEHQFRRLERDGTSMPMQAVREIEQQFALTARPIPQWVAPTVMFLGGVAVAAPALDENADRDNLPVALVFSSMLFVNATAGLAMSFAKEAPYNSYVKALQRVRLAPLGPNGSIGFSLGFKL